MIYDSPVGMQEEFPLIYHNNPIYNGGMNKYR